MNESIKTENTSVETEKPVQMPQEDDIKFPPFPEPRDIDFDDDISATEREHYKIKFKDLNSVTTYRIHCTACDRHLGCSARSETRLRPHPMLRTLMCHTCHTFYNSGEFEKGDDGSELYCRWCGQGGQVYCCSACPHVFCAKCIKRNLGIPMIKEIEDTDDWKCFKCNPKYLWDLRGICWAVQRYCDLKNRITYATQDPVLKEAYQKECTLDRSTCCKNKTKRKNEERKIKQKEEPKKNATVIPKVPSTIQVKKFASINVDDSILKIEKKPQKRPASPKNKPIIIKNPLAIGSKILSPVIMPPIAKKMRMTNASLINPVRFSNDKKSGNSYTRIRPQAPVPQMMFNGYNSNTPFNQMLISDNINLSLESLTQGLDMATVAGMANSTQDNDVVCTPDFPLEPLCEVTEDTNDDDVQCIGPVVAPKGPAAPPPPPPPPLVPRNMNPLANLSTDNIIQMTENDVTVNALTGGLKFRVDPQTLSSNKMYRLPDGRIFAINANPNMPGGYSATIVAVTDDAISKMPPKGATYAAKLSTVGNQILTPPPLKEFRNQNNRNKPKRNTPKNTKPNKRTETPTRDCDMNVPVEWFRYNVIDAVDALEYSLSRLNKLKQEATTAYLRSRSITEMRNLHKRLERLLNTSTSRFNEIRENINKEFKQYLLKKIGGNTSEDDDDVEILHDDNDDPIFIDENSVESTVNESQEVDLTVLGSSDHNDSSEKSLDKNDTVSVLDPMCVVGHQDSYNDDSSILPDKIDEDEQSEKPDSSMQVESILPDNSHILDEPESKTNKKQNVEKNSQDSTKCKDRKKANGETEHSEGNNVSGDSDISATNITSKESEIGLSDVNSEEGDEGKQSGEVHEHSVENRKDEEILKDDTAGQYHNEKKTDDSDMSEEMIESLLKDEPEDIGKENLTAKDIPA